MPPLPITIVVCIGEFLPPDQAASLLKLASRETRDESVPHRRKWALDRRARKYYEIVSSLQDGIDYCDSASELLIYTAQVILHKFQMLTWDTGYIAHRSRPKRPMVQCNQRVLSNSLWDIPHVIRQPTRVDAVYQISAALACRVRKQLNVAAIVF